MEVIAAIPTIGESPMLWLLVQALDDDPGVDEVLVMVNDPGTFLTGMGHFTSKVKIIRTPGPSIYPGWNHAISYGAERGAHVAILNDDIAFDDPLAVSKASDLLARNPRYVVLGFNYDRTPGRGPAIRPCRGSYRHGGVGGFAFVVDAARCPLVDEQFEWWGGDDDLFFQVEKTGGRLAVANALTVCHVAETTAHRHAWTHEARERDRVKFQAKWGSSW